MLSADGPIFVDRRGEVIDHERWSELWNDRGYRQVAFSASDDGEIRVSTVWLGFDPGCSEPSSRRVFETMIVGGERGEASWHWSSEAEALAGHADVAAAALRGRT